MLIHILTMETQNTVLLAMCKCVVNCVYVCVGFFNCDLTDSRSLVQCAVCTSCQLNSKATTIQTFKCTHRVCTHTLCVRA